MNKLPDVMTAARLHAIGSPFQLDQLPVPQPRPTDVLVRVRTAGMVQNLRNVTSRYAVLRPNRPLPKLPAVFGLDSVGIVAAVGTGVKTGVEVGDRVYVNPGLSCGSCLACRKGNPTCCPAYTFMGYFGFGPQSQDQFDSYPYGGFSEYLTAPVQNLVRLPDNVSDEQASRFGYLGTAYSAFKKAGFSAGQSVLVDGGTGTLGLGAVLLALAIGASKVFATGRDPTRLQRVRSIDPDRVVTLSSEEGSIAEQVLAQTQGRGVDVALETLAPETPVAHMAEAFKALGRGGKLVNIGGISEHLPIPPVDLMCLQKSVIGSLWFTTAECEEMAAIAGGGSLKLEIFENKCFALHEINEALDALDSRAGGFTNVLIRHDADPRAALVD